MSLRDHLLAAQAGQSLPGAATSPPTATDLHVPYQSPGQHIDPAIGGNPGHLGLEVDMDDDDHGGRKGRRELSTSKRAAQNRAAQRAFRLRKEQYISSLKDQVKEHQILAQNFDMIQKENLQLRQYIITLQARLLESHTELPPPPESIDLSRAPTIPAQSAAPTAQMTAASSLENQLQAAAAAAAAADDSEAHRSKTKGSTL